MSYLFSCGLLLLLKIFLWDLTMLFLNVAVGYSFSLLYNFPLYKYTTIYYLFCWWIFGLFPVWSVKNIAASNYASLHSREHCRQFLSYSILTGMWKWHSLSNFGRSLAVMQFFIMVLMYISWITNKIEYLPPASRTMLACSRYSVEMFLMSK